MTVPSGTHPTSRATPAPCTPPTAALATVATFGFDDFDPPVILDLYRRLGCTRCQFYRNPENPPDEHHVRRVCADAGLEIDSIHGLFAPHLDPSNPDQRLRRASVDAYRAEAELALRLRAPAVVVHPAPLTPARAPSLESDPDRAAAITRSMLELAELGRSLRVVFLIENLPNEGLYGRDAPALAEKIRRIDSPYLRMCFDVGHAHITGSAPHALARCADVVNYLHIHDNDGHNDSHLMPGDGTADWEAIARVIQSTGLAVSAMLEVFYLRDRLCECLNGDLARRLGRLAPR